MKALVGAFNQEKALVGAFSVIVQPVVEPLEYYTTLHRVNIAPWIYGQLTVSRAPLHPVLPPLLEAYIASVLTVPSSRAGAECHNEPLTEAEIQTVFSPPMFDLASETGAVSSSGYTAQLCILYYILLYEDTRLTTTTTRQQTVAMPRPHKYSQD